MYPRIGFGRLCSALPSLPSRTRFTNSLILPGGHHSVFTHICGPEQSRYQSCLVARPFRRYLGTAAMPPTPVLVVDFDDTITEGDTIGLLINAAIQAQSRGEPTTQETQERQEAQRALKNRLVSEYVEAFQVLVQRHLPENTHRKDTGLNMEHISGFLDDLNDFEIRMNSKVTDSGILAGLQEADIEGVARAVSVRQHARETIKAALQKGWQVHVLSVNWSAALIRAVLAGIPSRIDREGADNLTLDAGDQQAVVIHANSLEMQFGISTGNINCSVQGPLDKGNILEDLLLDIAAASGDGSSPCVYIGDSVGDLSALLVANRPVVLGNNAMLQHALRTFGCQLAPIAGTGVSLTDNPLTPGSVLHADSWLQIFEWLFPAATLGGAASPGRASNAAPTTPPAGGSMNRAASHTISAGDSGRHPETPGTARGTFTDLDATAEATPPTPGLPSTTQHAPALPRVASGVSTGVATGPPTGAAAPRSTTPARVLVIAGSDSGGGAGIQADVRACMANHAFAATAISALTAQNSHGVHGVHVPPVDTVEEQMTAVLGDIGADAIKTGMLPTAEIVRKVAQVITEHKEKGSKGMPVVVDPVLVSTSGSSLSEDSAVAAMKAALLPVATVLTPNLTEASTLLGGREISTVQHMRDAARDLAKLGPQAVLIKGGHLPPSPPVDPPTADPTATPSDPQKSGSAGAPLTERSQSDNAAAAAITVTPPGVTRISVSLDAPAQPSAQLVVDVLYDSSTGETVDLPTPRVDTPNTHGTGCTLASALAARLAQGTSLVAAVTEAQQYVHACIADSVCLSLGSGPQGAMDHGAGLCAPASATGVKGGATGGATGGLREPPGVWGESVPAPVVVEPEQRTLDYAVYVVTDPGMNTTCNRSTGEAVSAAIKGGATVVQIREKNLDGCCFLERVRDALEVARPAGVPVIVNDRVDVALAAGADGVHIGQDDLPCLEVRRIIGDRMILGVSAANSTEARKAAEEGADYVGVGAVYATTTKEDSTAIGLKGLEEVVQESPLPVVAIGGINHDNVAKVMGSGCAGVAVVSCVFATPDVEQAVRNLRGKMGLNEAVSAAE